MAEKKNTPGKKKSTVKPVSIKRKVILKRDHAKLDPDKLKPAERNIYNKRKAGLIRQENAIKDDNGKFINKYYENEIARLLLAGKNVDVSKLHSDQTEKFAALLKAAGVTKKDLKDFFISNKDLFADMVKKGTLIGTSKDSADLEEIIENFKRKIFVNDGTGNKETPKIEASMLLKMFQQALATNCNAADFAIFLQFSFDGDLIINIPNVETLMKEVKTLLNVENDNDILLTDPGERSEAIEAALNKMYDGDPLIIVYISK